MNLYLCGLFVLLSFFINLLKSQLHYLMMSQLTFCADVESPHFFCNPLELLKIACKDTSTNNILSYFTRAILGHVLVSGIFFSCYKIISFILKVSSPGEKTFSPVLLTCQLFAYFINQALECTSVQLPHLS